MNTLTYFEQIINVELVKQFTTSDTLSQEFVASVLDGDRRYKRQKQSDLLFIADDIKSSQELTIGVRVHQGKLVTLLDKVISYLPVRHREDMALPEEKDTVYLLKYLYGCLMSGLSYLERKFRCHIDKEMGIPAGEVISLSRRAREELPLITGSPRMQQVPAALSEIVTKPLLQLSEVMNIQQPLLTWQRKHYLLRLLEQLKKFIAPEELPDQHVLTKELHALLQQINFNKRAYINYMISLLEEEADEQRNIRDKCTMIIMQQRRISRCISEKHVVYDISQPPVREQLLEWLGYELDCFESMLRLDVISNTDIRQCLN
ncbi:hypothetical protein [Chitinophaga rhizophila]|uniref:Uncharacterized protein n=1 Tax=Chitinophaga rhizophila TaxID=2866212 RepID=A0ABS7G809_9BACT|nr:hypothetical protein [Chitinophaga rhizophila]MBW8683783.1 hypothetical protein [Chitinophaga rhizophila]